jgi:hypothetical protein
VCKIRVHGSNNFVLTTDPDGRHWVRNWSRNCRVGICLDPKPSNGIDQRSDYEFLHVFQASDVLSDMVAADARTFFVYDPTTGLWSEHVRETVAYRLRDRVDRGHVEDLTPRERAYLLSNKGMSNVLASIWSALLDTDLLSRFDRVQEGRVPFENGMYVVGEGFRPFVKEDYVTTTIGYPYEDEDAVRDDMRFLESEFFPRMFPYENEREFFLTLMGYALLGDGALKHFVVLTDARDGYNGKTTVMRLQERTFGGLAAKTQNQFLYPARNTDPNAANPTNLHYKGKRLAFFEEPDEGKSLSCSWLKMLTGGDVDLSARANFSNEIQSFPFRAFIVIAANEGGLPFINSSDAAFVRRMIVVPMRPKFVKHLEDIGTEEFTHLQDTTIGDRLKRCRMANFHVIARAYERVYNQSPITAGLGPEPPGFVAAKQLVLDSNDPITDMAETFATDCLDITDNTNHKVAKGDLSDAFRRWAQSRKALFPCERVPAKRKLEKLMDVAMSKRARRLDKTKTHYVGVVVRDTSPSN